MGEITAYLLILLLVLGVIGFFRLRKAIEAPPQIACWVHFTMKSEEQSEPEVSAADTYLRKRIVFETIPTIGMEIDVGLHLPLKVQRVIIDPHEWEIQRKGFIKSDRLRQPVGVIGPLDVFCDDATLSQLGGSSIKETKAQAKLFEKCGWTVEQYDNSKFEQ